MPKFHFEIIDGIKLEDPVGMELKSEDQAKQLAENIARQIAIDVKDSEARNVVVKTEDGSEIHKVPVKTLKACFVHGERTGVRFSHSAKSK